MTKKQKDALWNTCLAFIERHQINCSENIYQSDTVVLNSQEFIETICNIVGYYEFEDES
jgi:hypothetical protein